MIPLINTSVAIMRRRGMVLPHPTKSFATSGAGRTSGFSPLAMCKARETASRPFAVSGAQCLLSGAPSDALRISRGMVAPSGSTMAPGRACITEPEKLGDGVIAQCWRANDGACASTHMRKHAR